jgi:hypothetical protein
LKDFRAWGISDMMSLLGKEPLKISTTGDQLLMGIHIVLPIKRKLKKFFIPQDV